MATCPSCGGDGKGPIGMLNTPPPCSHCGGKGYVVDSQNNESNCFVATAVYQNNTHPNVQILREFRDEKLSKYKIGRWFIRWYYRHGPSLAKIPKKYESVRLSIKAILDKLVKLL